VNAEAANAFRRRVLAIRENFDHRLTLVQAAATRAVGAAVGRVKVDAREQALEAHVRAFVIDPMLEALGWDLLSAGNLDVEDPVDPVAGASGNRRFLDYHGKDCELGKSFLIVEAKRPSTTLPAGSRESAKRIVDYLTRRGTPSPEGLPIDFALRGEWQEFIDTLRDYALRVVDRQGHPPACAAITNGEWMILFRDVSETLLATAPDIERINVFSTRAEFDLGIDTIYGALNYIALSGNIPPQHPAALPEFVPVGQEPLCVHALDVSHVLHGERQPAISVRVVAWVRTHKGAWVLFSKDYSGDDFVMLDSDSSDPAGRRTLVENRAADLMRELRDQRPIRLMTATDFECSVSISNLSGIIEIQPRSPLIGKIANRVNQYRLTTGTHPTYLLPDRTYSSCDFHSHDACASAGQAAIGRALYAPSKEPPAYFANRSIDHCAHLGVHTRRRDKCLLLPFEQFQCCRRCAFQTRCWPENEALQLPCVRQAGG
jgi:hypothetical protein